MKKEYDMKPIWEVMNNTLDQLNKINTKQISLKKYVKDNYPSIWFVYKYAHSDHKFKPWIKKNHPHIISEYEILVKKVLQCGFKFVYCMFVVISQFKMTINFIK